MRRLVSFGSYSFPDTVARDGEVLRTSFAQGQELLARAPGADGAYDLAGDDPYPTKPGSIRCRFKLVAESGADMQAQRDALLALTGYGRALLTAEFGDDTLRTTYAKAVAIEMPIDHDSWSERIADVSISFLVPFPRWESANEDSPQTEACSGTNTTFSLVNAGSALALPVITIDPGASDISASGLTIQRLVDSVVVDEIEYSAALDDLDALVIDCKALSVKKNGGDAYSDDFVAQHPAWMRLAPGSNSIKVILGGGESASVQFAWADTWY